MNTQLKQAFRQYEKLITRDAESLDDPAERQAEFQRRLERTRRLLAHLGDPQDRLDIIHIGGTSGKGSIAMMCDAILRAGGLLVGTHTSPYLQTPLEKVRVKGRLAAGDSVIALTERVMNAVQAVRDTYPQLGAPHYAEAWLALALLATGEAGCQAGVVEVGMGGRYDSTNIVLPRVSVITTVHYDHMLVLGDTIEDIAGHKAGIIKSGVPVVVGEMPDAAKKVIEREAAQRGSRLIRLGNEVQAEMLAADPNGGVFHYEGPHRSMRDVHVGLLGAHQIRNAALAIAAIDVMGSLMKMPIAEQAIREGLAQVQFAGRLELMSQRPTVLLDGAHNEEKIEALIKALSEMFGERRLILVLGMLRTKNAAPIIESLAEIADVIVTTAPDVKGKPALTPDEIAEMIPSSSRCEVMSDGEPLSALDTALSMAGDDDLVVVTGSLYLLGAARGYWYDVNSIEAQGTMFPTKAQDRDEEPMNATSSDSAQEEMGGS